MQRYFINLGVLQFLFVISLFGTSCPCPPDPCSPIQERYHAVPGFNAPDRIAIDDCWDIYTFLEITCQMPVEENLELGFINNRENGSVKRDGKWVNPDFHYEPGFKLGVGVNLDRDHWDMHAKYTWFGGEVLSHIDLDLNGAKDLYPTFPAPDILSAAFYNGRQSWKLRMDLVDVALARRFCIGKQLSVHPFFAVRAAWIRQHMQNAYENQAGQGVNYDTVIVDENTHSWGLGPRVGLDMNWGLGKGWDFYGIFAGDLVFTQYTTLTMDQVSLSSGVRNVEYSFSFRQSNLNYLRHHVDFETGFGWGMYFRNNQYHINLRTGYVFEAFFNQNMFRLFTDDLATAKSLCPHGDLYIHGLSVKARLDF